MSDIPKADIGANAAKAVEDAEVICTRCGKTAPGLDFAPMGGALGQRILETVCAACYDEWVGQQVLYINHYGLQMSDPDDRKKLIAVMKEFLHIDTA